MSYPWLRMSSTYSTESSPKAAAMMDNDAGTYDGPAILEGLRRSREAHQCGDTAECQRIVDQLVEEHGAVPVNAILGALRFGCVSLDPLMED